MSDEPTQQDASVEKPGLLACIRADIRVMLRGRRGLHASALVATNRGLHAMLLYRLSHVMRRCGIPILPLILTRLSQHLFAVDIDPDAELGPGVVIVHGFGVVIGRGARIDGYCCLYHGVTLGNRGSEWVGSEVPDGQPVVESDVIFGAGAKVLGPVRIGRNSVVGANAVVLRSVPANSIVAGVPARVIGQRPESALKFSE